MSEPEPSDQKLLGVDAPHPAQFLPSARDTPTTSEMSAVSTTSSTLAERYQDLLKEFGMNKGNTNATQEKTLEVYADEGGQNELVRVSLVGGVQGEKLVTTPDVVNSALSGALSTTSGSVRNVILTRDSSTKAVDETPQPPVIPSVSKGHDNVAEMELGVSSSNMEPGADGIQTELHQAVASPSSTIGKLGATLLALGTSAATKRDEMGRLPLHLLSRNELLIALFLNQAKQDPDRIGLPSNVCSTAESHLDRTAKFLSPSELDKFVLDLVRAYPQAVVCPDGGGQIPFAYAIQDWVEYSARGKQEEPGNNGGVPMATGNIQIDVGDAELGVPPAQSQGRRSTRFNNPEDTDEGTAAQRSFVTNLTNITLPSAFRSIYSSSRESTDPFGTRATFRTGGKVDSSDIEGGYRSQASVSNIEGLDAYYPSPNGFFTDDEATVESNANFNRNNKSAKTETRSVVSTSFYSIDDLFPLNVKMPAVVEWSFWILNLIYEHIDDFEAVASDLPAGASLDDQGDMEGQCGFVDIAEPQAGERRRNYPKKSLKNRLVGAVASIPSIVKTLLLVDDADPAKERVVSLPLVQRVMSSKEAVGNWIVYMLEAVDQNVAMRAVDYFEYLSSNANQELTLTQQSELFTKVGELNYLVPAILSLENVEHVNRAAQTRVICHVLDDEYSMRQILGLSFLDIFFQITLLMSFTLCANNFLLSSNYNGTHKFSFIWALICILYFVTRKLSQMFAMVKISESAMLANSFRNLDIIEWASTGIVLCAVVAIEVDIQRGRIPDDISSGMRSFLAVAAGALWLKVFVWFATVNTKLSRFVEILGHIIHDIKVYLVVLTFSILAFGQVMNMLALKKDCDGDLFCDAKHVYLHTYYVAAGYYVVDKLRTPATVMVFVLLCLVVSMLLFHTLIAMVVDSYNKAISSRWQAERWGDRSRLVYCADLRAISRLVGTKWTTMQHYAAALFVVGTVFLLVVAAAPVRQNLADSFGEAVLGAGLGIIVVALLTAITVFVSHMTYFDFAKPEVVRSRWSQILRFRPVRMSLAPIRGIMHVAMGLNGADTEKDSLYTTGRRSRNAKFAWFGSVVHVNRNVNKVVGSAERETISAMRAEMAHAEKRMKAISDRTTADVLAEVRASEERMEKLLMQIQATLSANAQVGLGTFGSGGASSFHSTAETSHVPAGGISSHGISASAISASTIAAGLRRGPSLHSSYVSGLNRHHLKSVESIAEHASLAGSKCSL